MTRRRISVVTGSRAEYGILLPVLRGIQQSKTLELQLIVTGMHLSPEFGLTFQDIIADGFNIDARVEMLLSSDTPVGVAKSIGLGIIGMAEALDRLRPDMLLLIGDRFEILAAAQAALVARIPVAHIAGGDSTEGAFDEAIRHSLTKMSHVHFVTNRAAAERVARLGEDPRQIHTTGSPALDAIRGIKLLGRAELEAALEFTLRKQNLLVTFHPVTLESDPADVQFDRLLDALDRLGNEVGIIFTLPNADIEGRGIIARIDRFVSARPNTRAFTSLGQLCYFSAIAAVDAVVGNSSSGLYEVPSFGKPTVNVGDRQKGRITATSVINVPVETDAILQAIRSVLTMDCRGTINPYGDGASTARIIEVLEHLPDPSSLLKKHFFDGTEQP